MSEKLWIGGRQNRWDLIDIFFSILFVIDKEIRNYFLDAYIVSKLDTLYGAWKHIWEFETQNDHLKNHLLNQLNNFYGWL